MKHHAPIEIIAPVSSLSNRTRLYKLASYLLENKQIPNLKHVAWVRESHEAEEVELPTQRINKVTLINGGGYGGRLTKLLYCYWMIRVFFYCLIRQSNTPVWALGFESAFPAILAAKIRKFEVIFDDADRFSMVFPFPSPIKKFIQVLENFTSHHCSLHVIPGTERYSFSSNKFFILRNTPSIAEITKARAYFRSKEWPKARIVINVNGWLGKDRGMSAALAIANHFDQQDVALLVAGKVDCDEARQLIDCGSVTYLGKLTNAEALATYLCSDFVLTYYDPKYEINTLAQSNKWGDALLLGTKVIVNSEVKTANFLREIDGCITCSYHDHFQLINELEIILEKGFETLRKPNASIRSFEMQLEQLFSRLDEFSQVQQDT
ncbi:hypothetical protein [Thalassotalea fusca]